MHLDTTRAFLARDNPERLRCVDEQPEPAPDRPPR